MPAAVAVPPSCRPYLRHLPLENLHQRPRVEVPALPDTTHAKTLTWGRAARSAQASSAPRKLAGLARRAGCDPAAVRTASQPVYTTSAYSLAKGITHKHNTPGRASSPGVAGPVPRAATAPSARRDDVHGCPIPGHGKTKIVTFDPKVFADGRGVARVGDKAECGAAITEGCPTVS